MATAARSKGGAVRSGRRPMPVGDLPGWRQVFTEGFDIDVPVGGFIPKPNSPGSGGLTQGGAADGPYGGKLTAYPSGFAAGASGTSRPEQVLSVQDSCLTYDFMVNAAGEYTAATVQLLVGSFVGPGSTWPGYYTDPTKGLRVDLSFRVQNGRGLAGWGGVAFWNPSNEDWSARRGEMDFIEGSLSQNMETNWHPWKTYVTGDGAPRWGSQAYGDGVDHLVRVDWVPYGNAQEPTGRESVWIDGVLIGETRTMVARDPRKLFIFQTGANATPPPPAGTAIPGGGVQPADGVSRGRLLVDYIVAYEPTANVTTKARMKGGTLTSVNVAGAGRMKGGALRVASTTGRYRYDLASGKWRPVTRYRYDLASGTWKARPYGTL